MNQTENNPVKARYRELAQRSFDNNQYTFTAFMNMEELSDFYIIRTELEYAHPTVFGGYENSERCMIRFGSKETFGYEETFPIAVLEISPVAEKFADDLNHRDFLGSLMNLGIERNTLGDILVKEKHAYVFCASSMADYIIKNLTRIKHTTVTVREVDAPEELITPKFEEKLIQVSSSRIDAIIAKTFNFSRTVAVPMFQRGMIYLNGRECTENAKNLKNGDVISVRGHGKFIFEDTTGLSKKGKENIKIKIYK